MRLFDLVNYEFSIFSVPPFFTAVATLSMALLILIRERRSIITVSFFLLSSAVAVWQLAYVVVYASTSQPAALWWIKLSYLGAPFIAAATYQFTVAALHIERKNRRIALVGWVAASIFCAIAIGTDWIIGGTYLYTWGYHPHFTWGGVLFLCFFFSMFAASMNHYMAEYRAEYSETYRRRIKLLMIALAVAYIGSVDFVGNFGIPLYPFGYIGVLGFLGLTIRAILSHRLAEITPAFAAGQIISTMNEALLVLDPEGIVRLASPSAIRLLGCSEAELVGRPAPLSIDGRPVGELLQSLAEADQAQYQEISYCYGPGDCRIINLSVSALRGDRNQPVAFVCIGRDVTERKRSEEALRDSEARFHAMFENVLDPIVIMNDNGVVVDSNPAAVELLGRDEGDLLNRHYTDFVLPERALHSQKNWSGFLKRDEEKGNLQVVRADGEIRYTEYYARTNFLPGIHLAVLRDITERKALEERLAHQAYHDVLTGLPNRALFMDRLAHALARRRTGGGSVALLFLDLDDFKVINDSLGHKAGDRLLVMVGQRLSQCLRTGDTVARLGGDEFTILLEDADTALAATVADRVAEQLKVPFDLDGHEISTTTSIGIALAPAQQEEPDDLLRNADMALYEAKRQKKARYVVFDDSMNSKAWQRLECEIELRHALEHGEFAIYYQPIVDLRTYNIVEVEALLRWRHPVRGIVSPADFIPTAEETGLIVPIGQWVLKEACKQVKAWQDLQIEGPRLVLSANLSARQFHHPGLIDDISSALESSGLNSDSLKLEITESVALENTQVTLATLHALRELGIQIAIDDFGAGYSALSYVKYYPIDTLKLDRSFVNGLGREPADTAIVHAALAFAKALGLKVTAEGVETSEQIRQLQELGCEQGQGFYFARPLPPEEAGAMLHPQFTHALKARMKGEGIGRPTEMAVMCNNQSTQMEPTR